MSIKLDLSRHTAPSQSQHNIPECTSDIQVFVNEYRNRITSTLTRDEVHSRGPFTSFAESKLSVRELTWLQDNNERFFKDTANKQLVQNHYLLECGFICSMIYTPDGEFIIVGHATGLIQLTTTKMADTEQQELIEDYGKIIKDYYKNELQPNLWYPMFYDCPIEPEERKYEWVKQNEEKFLKNTPNKMLQCRWFSSEKGAITALEFSPNGYHIIVGHASGAIEMDTSIVDPPPYCIRADPMLESLTMQFYGSPGISSYATPFIAQRFPALSLGLLTDSSKMAVGYADTSIRVYDMETQEAESTYKVHKLRLQFIPKKLQRMHYGQVVALRTHPHKPYMFASGAWDKTLRIWDVRCQVGCVMTFEGVDICGDAIDLNREYCLAGSWMPTEALTVWDLTARKQLNIIRVQNRRQDVDGEYIYACRYWRSSDYNRKGKYAVVGGSGTNCLEVINLHNRYITCSYPASGTILAVTSYQERIAFGGTSSAFNIVAFYDPKHQKDKYETAEPEYEYSKASGDITLYQDSESELSDVPHTPSCDSSKPSKGCE